MHLDRAKRVSKVSADPRREKVVSLKYAYGIRNPSFLRRRHTPEYRYMHNIYNLMRMLSIEQVVFPMLREQ